MNISNKYDKTFMDSFNIDEKTLGADLKYESIQEWDSIGHMALIAELEDAFEISMDMDDIIEFSSYEKGKIIMEKYNIKFE